ncbi:predicted protein [Uncinocarpus reesii 1704]|uniref:Clathrin light chain n=1 Tax=Uncinocarpus reesii (strain UAMH 1704) TaxID=336963 RepID=C4JQ60_UNCRE|nr:uncharacterized protein UREG_03293 [Uncinocarpus reesii 1704]EEP78447.1 predicted protein [Uncinocarpus reesii 1704]
MADRFPSLDELGDQPLPTTSDGPPPTGDGDDFLARERAALGDDADQFVSANDHIKSPTVEDDGDDLLGDGEFQQGDADTAGFESSFPALESQNEQVAPGGTITGTDTFQQSYSTYQEPEEEAEAVREWRTKRDEEIARRAAVSSERKAATIKKAQEDIDDYYESYNKRTDKAKERTRTEAEDFLGKPGRHSGLAGTSWNVLPN